MQAKPYSGPTKVAGRRKRFGKKAPAQPSSFSIPAWKYWAINLLFLAVFAVMDAQLSREIWRAGGWTGEVIVGVLALVTSLPFILVGRPRKAS